MFRTNGFAEDLCILHHLNLKPKDFFEYTEICGTHDHDILTLPLNRGRDKGKIGQEGVI